MAMVSGTKVKEKRADASARTRLRVLESFHGFLTAHWDHEPGALRRPRRVQRRNGSARYYAGGDIAARCPYQSTGSWVAGQKRSTRSPANAKAGEPNVPRPVPPDSARVQE